MSSDASKSNSTRVVPSNPSNEPRPKPERPGAGPKSKTEQDVAEAGASTQLTGAQLKKQKAAEKAARRAGKVAEKGAQAPDQQGPSEVAEGQQRPLQRQHQQQQQQTSQGPSKSRTDALRDQSSTSSSLHHRPPSNINDQSNQSAEKKLDKRFAMVSHLYPTSRRATLSTASREIHPAVLTLALQFRDYVICGSNARTVATLLVFKKVIQAYNTPTGVALSRHLTQHLSGQITYLSHARPLSVSQGNSIRWLKKLISALDPDLGESEAKTFLCTAIDSFIRERVTLADEVIAREAGTRIESKGEVILTYGKSSVVEKTLLNAWKAGKVFRVVCVDSRPLFEGKNLARSLIRAGMTDVKYCLLSGLGDVVQQERVTKCFLGASAMLGNGRLSSRAGTAMVAMMAKEGSIPKHKVPVIVLCESVKFTARVALDSLMFNEVADADLLVGTTDPKSLTQDGTMTQTLSQPKQDPPPKKGGKPGDGAPTPAAEDNQAKRGLQGWKNQPNLYLLNLMYDVTPAEYLDMVISELGSLPPNAVPVVNGVHGGDEQ